MTAFQKWALALGTSAVAFLAPVHTLLVCVAVLVGLDCISGVARAFKLGDRISSSKLKRTVYKSLLYTVAILGAFMLETIAPGVLPFAKLVAGMIGAVELKSILENTTSVTGVGFGDVIKKLAKNESKE